MKPVSSFGYSQFRIYVSIGGVYGSLALCVEHKPTRDARPKEKNLKDLSRFLDADADLYQKMVEGMKEGGCDRHRGR